MTWRLRATRRISKTSRPRSSSARPAAEVYRDLRAAAESGWDFSSRWLADGKTLGTIRTTDFLPVDLNSLLYQLELTIARACKAAQRRRLQQGDACDTRKRGKAAMLRLMWDEQGRCVRRLRLAQQRADRSSSRPRPPIHCSSDSLSKQQAQRVARTMRASLLMPHGLATTTEDTGQQWDAPNGWAPLQWIAIDGLRRNGEDDLAAKIAARWVAENARVYCKTGKLVEKYNVRDAGRGRGRRIPGAGRLRLDQRGADQATGDLSEAWRQAL